MYQTKHYQRDADIGETQHIRARHLQVLADIDATGAEVQEAAEDYKAVKASFAATMKGHRERERSLRVNLINGTVTVTVEVKPEPDTVTGRMHYTDKDGKRVLELERALTDYERQTELFPADDATTDEEAADELGRDLTELETAMTETEEVETTEPEAVAEMETFDPATLPAYDPPVEFGEPTTTRNGKRRKPVTA